MDIVRQLGYLTIGVSDLDEGIEFYSRIARLTVTERRGATAFMTGGMGHHWIRLEESSTQGVKRVAFEAMSEESLQAVRAELQADGVPFLEGGDMAIDRVDRWLRFTDPGGIEVELFLRMMQRPVAPASPGVVLEKFLHAAWEAPNYEASYAFYTRVLGFRPSDFVGDTASFLRCADRYHHSLVLVRGSQPLPKFNHFCIQVEALDDVMRFRHNAIRHGASLRDDLLRHAPSGSIGVYVHDVARGLAVEYCYAHPRLDADHIPRILPQAPETTNVWSRELPDLRSTVLG